MNTAEDTITSPSSSGHFAGPGGVDYVVLCVFIICLLHSFWAPVPHIGTPLLGPHGFRESQTALATRCVVENGPALAMELPVLGPPWAMPQEFPLFQWMVAGVVAVLGTDLETTGRLVGLLFFFLSLGFLFVGLKQLGININGRLIALSLTLSSPLYLVWSSGFLIETLALCLGICYTVAVQRAITKRTVWIILLAVLVGSLAGMVKVTTFAGFLFVAGILALKPCLSKQEASHASTVALAGLLLAIPIAFTYGWYVYAESIRMLNPLAEATLSNTYQLGWIFGTAQQKLSSEVWTVTLIRSAFDLLGNPFVLVLLVFPLLLAVRQKWLHILFLIFFLVPIAVFTNLHFTHTYYQVANGVFLICAIALVLYALHQRGGVWKSASQLMVCVVAGLQIWSFNTRHGYETLSFDEEKLRLAEYVAQQTDPEEVIVILGIGWSPEIPYYSHRRALMIPSELSLFGREVKASLEHLGATPIGALLICDNARPAADAGTRFIEQVSLKPTPDFSAAECQVYLPESH